jgi:hypothetical protein
MEGVLVIATLAQRWRLKATSSSPVEIEARITLCPKQRMLMMPEERHSSRPAEAS